MSQSRAGIEAAEAAVRLAELNLSYTVIVATADELRETLGHIQFLDYYIRFTLRGNVVAALADAGLKRIRR